MNTDNTPPRTWLVLTFGDDRTYAGNLGYADDPRRTYRYDNFVQNHSRVTAGDVFVIRSRQSLLGLARVAEIRASDGVKTRRRCPSCGATSFISRTNKLPRFRCSKGHQFEEPRIESVPCTLFEAHLSDFVDAPGVVSIPALRAACPRYSSQTSIQEVDPDAIRWGLDAGAPAAVALLPPRADGTDPRRISPNDAFEGSGHPSHGTQKRREGDGFTPGEGDERELVERAIRLRRGQASFRRALVARYGSQCMISQCTLFHIVEAAHIAPFRRRADHSVANGLLLRADLHTLFDLDLLGINPETLSVHLHPAALAAGYSTFEGVTLACGGFVPSRAALQARWERFQGRLCRD